MRNYDDLNLEELRDLCEERGLKKSGNKDELVARLELNDLEADGEADGDPGGEDAAATDVEGEADADEGDGSDDDSDDEGDDDSGESGPSDDEEGDAEEAAPTEGRPTPGRVAKKGDGSAPPVAKVKGRTAQQDPDRSPFGYSVLPDGRKAPFLPESDED